MAWHVWIGRKERQVGDRWRTYSGSFFLSIICFVFAVPEEENEEGWL